MSIPRPTPPPRNRKARRKLSRGQVAFLDRKAVRDKAKAERDKEQRLDAWHLTIFHPEIAKARRAKGVENHAEASAWRRRAFVESFTDWPEVLTPDALAYEIRNWLRVQRRMRWRGCPKRYPNKEASVRKKLTELEVFRYNIRAGVWFKVGSVEEAEATQRQAESTQRLTEQEAERRRLVREEAERVEAEKRKADPKMRNDAIEEAERKKAEAEQAERDRLSSPAVAGWHDFIPEELKPTALRYIRLCRWNSEAQCLNDAAARRVEFCLRKGEEWFLCLLRLHYDDEMRRVAEAVLVAD